MGLEDESIDFFAMMKVHTHFEATLEPDIQVSKTSDLGSPGKVDSVFLKQTRSYHRHFLGNGKPSGDITLLEATSPRTIPTEKIQTNLQPRGFAQAAFLKAHGRASEVVEKGVTSKRFARESELPRCGVGGGGC